MSDPAWASATLQDGHEGIVYVQAAGAGAPGTADELGWVSGFSMSNEAATSEKGPHINLARISKTIASYSASGEITVDLSDAADTVRDLFFTAMENKTRLKITYTADGGESHAFDQSIVGFSGEVAPDEGVTYTFTFDSDSYSKTNAT
jgi:hypothetical protein